MHSYMTEIGFDCQNVLSYLFLNLVLGNDGHPQSFIKNKMPEEIQSGFGYVISKMRTKLLILNIVKIVYSSHPTGKIV